MKDIKVLGRNKQKLAREILEAVAIDEKEDECVSAPSVALLKLEKLILRGS